MGCGIRDRVQKGYIPCKRIPTLNENDHRHVSIGMEHERGWGGGVGTGTVDAEDTSSLLTFLATNKFVKILEILFSICYI